MTDTDRDRRIFEEDLSPWLPQHIIDIHVHIGLAEHIGPISPERIAANWAIEVGVQQSWEQLWDNYRTLFPGHRVSALAFGGPYREVDVEANNAYVLTPPQPSPAGGGTWALMVTRPEWDAQVIERGMAAGFVGIKPYPDLAVHVEGDPSIFDFCPHSHLEALNRAMLRQHAAEATGGVLMMHLPRAGRLADPDNIRELIVISERYPRIKLIVAHIGRAFCLPTAEKGLPHFADHPSVYFDTSANLNADVFAYTLDVIGPDRLLFGSDLPITLMRGVREHVGETYVNYTDAPYSWNTNRKSAEEEANYTYYLYEELRALVAAVKRAGLGREAMEKIMFSNAAKLLGKG